MHEFSIVRMLVQQADAVRRSSAASQVTEIRIELGLLSGVEPLLLLSAFHQWQEQAMTITEPAMADPFDGTTLVIDHVPVTAVCHACEENFEVVEFQFRCPICHGRVEVTGGDQLVLVSVSVAGEQNLALSEMTEPEITVPTENAT